jgi:hypothetical protein
VRDNIPVTGEEDSGSASDGCEKAAIIKDGEEEVH